MKRRNFVRNGFLAGTALTSMSTATAFSSPNQQAPFNLKYAPHFGMFRNSAPGGMIDELQFMADQGFSAFEDNGMMKRSVEDQRKIADKMEQLGMEMGVFVIDKGGNLANTLAAGKQEHLDIFLDGCKRSVEVAKRVNAKWMTVVPGAFERNLPIGIQTGNVIEALKRGADILEPHGLVMVLEPLSDSPDLFLQHSDQTYEICKGVNSPSCKILFDIYHLQKTEGNLIRNIDLTWEEVGYFQVGDNPGRKEPTTGEINYTNIFKHLHGKGYTGIVGMEHGNAQKGKEGELAVINAYRSCDQFN